MSGLDFRLGGLPPRAWGQLEYMIDRIANPRTTPTSMGTTLPKYLISLGFNQPKPLYVYQLL